MTFLEQLQVCCEAQVGRSVLISRSLAAGLLDLLGAMAGEVELGGLLSDGQQLTGCELALLQVLYRMPGRVVETERLVAESGIKNKASLWVHIHKLRGKMNCGRGVIQSSRRGYWLELRHV